MPTQNLGHIIQQIEDGLGTSGFIDEANHVLKARETYMQQSTETWLNARANSAVVKSNVAILKKYGLHISQFKEHSLRELFLKMEGVVKKFKHIRPTRFGKRFIEFVNVYAWICGIVNRDLYSNVYYKLYNPQKTIFDKNRHQFAMDEPIRPKLIIL